MENEKGTVVGLTSPPLRRRQSVEQRVERRLEVLREWLREGIPLGKTIPGSLNEARMWDDLSLKIVPIGSPNEFTKSHLILGERVREIARLLTALQKRYQPSKAKRRQPATSPQTRFDVRAHDRQLQKAVSQWHATRDRALANEARANAAEARSDAICEENASKDKIIADLRRQLSRRDGLRGVK